MEKKLAVASIAKKHTGAKVTADTKVKTADYIYSHLQELTEMARQEDLPMLVYLLEMALIEAMDTAKQIRKRV